MYKGAVLTLYLDVTNGQDACVMRGYGVCHIGVSIDGEVKVAA